jgi:hypothetical protein
MAAFLMEHAIILLYRVQTKIKEALVMILTTVPVVQKHGVPKY